MSFADLDPESDNPGEDIQIDTTDWVVIEDGDLEDEEFEEVEKIEVIPATAIAVCNVLRSAGYLASGSSAHPRERLSVSDWAYVFEDMGEKGGQELCDIRFGNNYLTKGDTWKFYIIGKKNVDEVIEIVRILKNVFKDINYILYLKSE